LKRRSSRKDEGGLTVERRGNILDQWQLLHFVIEFGPSVDESHVRRIEELLAAWCAVGVAGGFSEQPEGGVVHYMSDLETDIAGVSPQTRFWIDMGSASELGVRVLLGMLETTREEGIPLRRVVIGQEPLR
jgi:hypothetical protein